MNVYLSGSNRKQNCYKILSDLKREEDVLFSLEEKSVNYCLGCGACAEYLDNFCIQEDDMQELYQAMCEAEKIIIATPIYMNHIPGILKNVIDRWNPYSSHEEILRGKKIYLITVGQMSEKENQEVVQTIQEYFESISEFMKFQFVFLRNFSSGEADEVEKEYANYSWILTELKNKIKTGGIS